MKTKKIVLYAQVTQEKIYEPAPEALQRKVEWIKELRRSLKPREAKVVKITYELFNREVERQRKFFNGPCIDYYVIQNEDLLDGEVPRQLHDRYREEILYDLLGYEVELVTRKERKRKSTGDFISTQHWHDFLETLRETKFEPNGMEFPDSQLFWDLEKKHGHDQAKKILMQQLQTRHAARLSTTEVGSK